MQPSSDFMVTVSMHSEPKKRKSITASTFYPSVCREVMGPDAVNLAFFFFFLSIFILSWLFHSLPSLSLRHSLVPLHFLPLERYHMHM